MRSTASRLFRSSPVRMALYQPPSSKLIFAPAGSQSHGQAEQFTLSTLSLPDLHPTSPILQFNTWFSAAQAAGKDVVGHPEACALSTAELPSGRVSSRMVYLKELEAEPEEGSKKLPGFVVYTNTGHSKKSADLRTNSYASLLFFWEALQRQVRVEGKIEFLTREESQVYFNTRARGSRIGAWASKQSQTLQPDASKAGETSDKADDGRAMLEGWVKEIEEKFEGQEEIPVPEYWGGLRLVPDKVEFWQGRESRLHDRFVYEKAEDGRWTLKRLSP